jgi:hypothetical protein
MGRQKDEGTTCHLKWAANPERALRGYRIYRLDGRFDKTAIPRLTAELGNQPGASDAASRGPAAKKTSWRAEKASTERA